jgi:hypothetical protein
MMNLREGPPEQKWAYSKQLPWQSQQFVTRGIGTRMTDSVLRTWRRQRSEETVSDFRPTAGLW